MVRKRKSNIPFPTSDPRYAKVWQRIKMGNTLEEALADIDENRATGKKPGRKKKMTCTEVMRHLVSIEEQLQKISQSLEKLVPTQQNLEEPQEPVKTQETQTARKSANGFSVGMKVVRIKNGEEGVVTRILPGKKEIEVRFMIGTKVLPDTAVMLSSKQPQK
jgi:hypothetical protein